MLQGSFYAIFNNMPFISSRFNWFRLRFNKSKTRTHAHTHTHTEQVGLPTGFHLDHPVI